MITMDPRVSQVSSLPDYRLKLQFTSGEMGIFDVTPYLSKGIFSELDELAIFNTVRPFNGTVVWPNELDFDPDTLYLESVKTPQPIS